jgi:hypothetical protein
VHPGHKLTGPKEEEEEEEEWLYVSNIKVFWRYALAYEIEK